MVKFFLSSKTKLYKIFSLNVSIESEQASKLLTQFTVFSYTSLFRTFLFSILCFHCLRAANSTIINLIVFMFFQHNIPCEITDVKVFNGEHREPKFVAMNPHEEVPILADGSTTVFGGFVSDHP